MNGIGKISDVLKHWHGSCVVCAFDKNLQQVSICNRQRAVLSFILHKYIFSNSLHHGKAFYDRYINTNDKTLCIYNDGSVVFQKRSLEIFIMRNIRRHMPIEVMLFPSIL